MRKLLRKSFLLSIPFYVVLSITPLFTVEQPQTQPANPEQQVIEPQINEQQIPDQRSKGKDWNFMVYMANNNDLHHYGIQNFRQMVKAGSSPYINVLLQMDSFGEKECARFLLEKNNPMIMETPNSPSGTPENLFEFAKWGIQNYPAKHQLLVLWNHGVGIKDPNIWGRAVSRWRDNLFIFNRQTGLLELDRKISTKIVDLKKTVLTEEERGIAFNDVAETYLTNEDLKYSLEKICQGPLNGEKIDILSMDACHMAMVEIASQVKNSVNFIVASEEVEPGAGYNYAKVLSPFTNGSLDSRSFSTHIVSCYHKEYKNTLADYTQSAIDLAYIDDLENQISAISSLLIELISEGGDAARQAIRQIRFNPSLSTEFYDNDYIDLLHFFKSLAIKADEYSSSDKDFFSFFQHLFPDNNDDKSTIKELWVTIMNTALNGINILNKMVFANTTGSKFPEACGLSIYFPVSSIHNSYYKTEFAKSTTWPNFLKKFLKTKRDQPTEEKETEKPEQKNKKSAKKSLRINTKKKRG